MSKVTQLNPNAVNPEARNALLKELKELMEFNQYAKRREAVIKETLRTKHNVWFTK